MAGWETLIGTAVDVGTNLLQNNNNLQENRAARDYDYKKWREYVHEIDPKTQVRKLQGAGLNPALAMSQGAIDSGNPNAAATRPEPYVSDFSPVAQGFRDNVQLAQDYYLKQEQGENLAANTENQIIRNRTQLSRDLMDLLKQYSEVDKNSKEGQLLWSQIQYTNKQIQAFDAQNTADLDVKRAQANEHNAHADYLKAQKTYQDILNRYTPKQQEIITKNLSLQSAAIRAAAAKDNAEAARAAAEKALADARKDGVDIANDVADSIADAQVDMAFSQSDEAFWKVQQAQKRFQRGTKGEEFPMSLGSETDIYPFRPVYSRHKAKRKRSKK